MISDVLLDAVERINEYLNDKDVEFYPPGQVRSKIMNLRNEMKAFALEFARAPDHYDGDKVS